MNRGKISALLALMVIAMLLAACASPDQPLGGLLHRYDQTMPATVHGKTELYLRFEKGQRIAVALLPTPTVRMSFTLWGPGADKVLDLSNRVINWTAPNPGDHYLNQTFITPDAGTYFLQVNTLEGEGSIRFLALPQGLLENETFCCGGTGANDALANAQNLDGYFWSATPGTERAAVFGELHGPADVDSYKFPVKAGESISLTTAGSTVTAPHLVLFDGSSPVAESSPDAANPLERIDNYSAVNNTVLTVQVSGSPETSYGLVVVRSGVVEKEGNHTPASAMRLPGDDGSPSAVLTGQKAVYGATGEIVQRDTVPAPASYQLAPFGLDANLASATFGAPNGLVYNNAPFLQLLTDGSGNSAPLDTLSVQFDEDGYVEAGIPSPVGLQTFHNTPASAQLSFEAAQLKSGTQQILSFHSINQPLFVTRMVSWKEGQNTLQVTYLFKNSNNQAMKDVAFVETLDPAPGGSPLTINTYQTGAHGQTVTAANDQGALTIGSADPRVVFGLGVGGAAKDVVDARDVFNNPAQPCAAPCTTPTDDAVSIAFNIGVLPARSLTQVTYVLAAGANGPDTEAAYANAQPETLVDAPTDEFALPLLPGQYVDITAVSPGSPDGMLYNPLNPALRLMGPDGKQFLYNDDAGGSMNAHLAFTVMDGQAGRYTIRVEPALTGRQSTEPKYINGGEYILTVWVHNPPKFAAASDQTVRRGQTLAVTAQASDPDLPGDGLTYSLLPGSPAGMQIDPATGALTWPVPADQPLGAYTANVMVKDSTQPYALWDKTTLNIQVLPDDVAPVTSLVEKPPFLSKSNAVAFTFTGADNLTPSDQLTYECALDGAGFAPCAGGFTQAGLAQGVHTFSVRATDADGNVDANPPVYTFAVAYQNFIPLLTH